MTTIHTPPDTAGLRAATIRYIGGLDRPAPCAISMRSYNFENGPCPSISIKFQTLADMRAWLAAERAEGCPFPDITYLPVEDSTPIYCQSSLASLEPVWHGWHQVELFTVVEHIGERTP